MDEGRKKTDVELDDLTKRITTVYAVQLKEVNDYFKKFEEKDKKMREKLENGKITEKEYKKWKSQEIKKSKQYKQMRKTIAEKLNNADKISAEYINNDLAKIYSLNRNYASYNIEESGVTVQKSFDLVDEATVKRLIETDPELLPNYPPERKIDTAKNVNYYQKMVTKHVTTGILLGESNQEIAKRLTNDLPNLGKGSAIRAARTATTNAENAGRLDTYLLAERRGINIQKQWMSTHDSRTRPDHLAADGQIVAVSEPFKVGGYDLMFPGDNKGHPSEVYNCRCTQIAVLNGKSNYSPNTTENFTVWQNNKSKIGQQIKKAIVQKNAQKDDEETTSIKSQSQNEAVLQNVIEQEREKLEKQIVRNADINFTNSEIDKMTRGDLETVAKAVFIKKHKELSEYEALKMCEDLIDGNTNSQLKKYIKKYMR